MLHAVTTEEAGQRADVLVARISGASRASVAEAIRSGRVAVNGYATKASRLLEGGDVVEFQLCEPEPLIALPEAVEVPILYEDEDLLVADKPAGMVTHPARSIKSGTLVNALLARVGGALPGDAVRPGLVHRLDRDTSGLIVVAKNAPALSALGKAMKGRAIAREYVGLVHGVPAHERGRIDGPIGRDPRNRLKFAIVSEGKPAVTHYGVREVFPKHAELTFRLDTGRTHQIRVHISAMGHALLNDPLYGRPEPQYGLLGQALHAWRLRFVHPRSGANMEFEAAPPPEYLRAQGMLREQA
ncbi:MAG: RluA family pseudouridine synthase [Candidatus Eremiobacteraeota bacterium]|nr:RluA family pseudouridine synthase [Candidatus Eremiobacteraeota bacterium]